MSRTYKTLRIKEEQLTAWITLNRPDKLNAINSTMLQDLSEALDTIEKNANIRCVIIRGEGEKAFSSGADIAELNKPPPKIIAEFSRKGKQICTKIETLSKPVIAAINGYALGGGLELALACDFRLASDHAELGFPEIKLGIIPGWGGTQRLASIIGVAEAKRLIILGDIVKAEEALRIGLVYKVVALRDLEDIAKALAQKLCEYHPEALKYAKYAINSVAQNFLEFGLKKETDFFNLLFSKKEIKKKIESLMSQRETKKGGDL